jgi:hypothetical protein
MTQIQRCEKLFNTSCTHRWGLHTIRLHLNSVIEGNHKQFVVVRYGIWCNLHDFKKMTCFGTVDFIKPNFVNESCCHV